MFDRGMYNLVGRFKLVFSSSIGGCDRMKTTPFSLLGRRGYLLVLNLLLTIGLTVLSFRYVQPKDCAGSCRVGEQKAGWPIPVFVDAPAPNSPLLLPGILGVDDYPDPGAVLLTVLFYSMLVWLVIFIIGRIQGQMLDPKLIRLSLLMNVLLALVMWIHYFRTGYYV